MKSINLEKAVEIAEREIQQVIAAAPELVGYEFGPVRLRRENPAFWVFSAGSVQLMEEGYVPGAVFACVDKTDGHLWTRAEQEQYFSAMTEPVSRAA